MTWHRIESRDSDVVIEFIPSETRYWRPEILRLDPIPVDSMRGRSVLLTGAGAVWMYAHAAAIATQAGADRVSVQTASPAGHSDDTWGCQVGVRTHPQHTGRQLVEINLKPRKPLADDVLVKLLTPIRRHLVSCPGAEITLTGRAPVGVYAELTHLAVQGGAASVACFLPTAGMIPVFGTPPVVDDWLARELGGSEPGLVIGVVGDPNVGKSCFSSVLDSYLRHSQIIGWRLDCDGQSPTPPWYLRSRAGGDDELAEQRRRTAKRPWDGEMEVALAEQLRHLRESLSITIADLPGGDHRPTPAQRIPAGRERIFAEIDRLVLIDRPDQPSEAQWTLALTQHQLLTPITAVIQSTSPESPPTLRELGSDMDVLGHTVWRGQATGLDRRHDAEMMRRQFGDTLVELWSHLTKRNPRN